MRYQRSFPIPPKTTLCGLLGAAIGYDEDRVSRLLIDTTVGVVENEREGIAKDLWRITKLKPGLSAETAVLIKEYFVHPRYIVYFAHKDKDDLEKWKNSFESPHYPLTLGSSDDLCIVKDPELIDLIPCNKPVVFRNTILPFNYKLRKTKIAKVEMRKGIKIEMPQVFSLPTKFEIKNNVRVGVDPLEFTYVSTPGLELFDFEGAWLDGIRSFFMF